MIFDTHAHYDDEAFDEDRDQLLSSMKDGRILLCMAQWGFIPTMQEL